MKLLFKKITSHPLIFGSLIIFLGSIISSFLNFLSNLFVTRNLSVADYGAIASLFSVATLFGFIISAFVPTIIKFASDSFATKNLAAVKALYKKIFFLFFVFGFSIFSFFSLFSKQIGAFFNIQQYQLIPLIGLMSLFGCLFLINTSIIQAKLSFGYLTFINFLASLIKLAFFALFILIGYGLTGIMWANLLSTVIPYMISFIPISFIFKSYDVTETVRLKKIISYGVPASLSAIAFTSFTTMDILLVKHFFNPHDAGLYAGVSLVGRVIFFLTAPVSTVMFPLVIQKKAQNEKYHTIFELALFLVVVASIGLSIFYYLFPVFTIEFFIKNKEYLNASYLLSLFAVFASIYAILSILINYFLSIGKTKIFIPVLTGAILQIIFIQFFHKNLLEVLLVSIFTTGLLLIVLLLYYLKTRHYEK